MNAYRYKKNTFAARILHFLYQNELLKYDFKTETNSEIDDQYFSIFAKQCYESVYNLIELQMVPITRKDKCKCEQAYHYIRLLTNFLEKCPNKFDKTLQIINSAISESGTKTEEFVDIIRQYVYSDIPPIILVELLHLIDSMMIYCKSFYINLFDIQFIDYLLSIIENPEKGIKKIFLTEDEEDENDEYNCIDNIFLNLEFDDVSKRNARAYSCEILQNIFKTYFKMEEEEEEEEEEYNLEVPPLQDIINYLIGGIKDTSEVGKESIAFRCIILLLLTIVKKYDQKIYEIDQETFVFMITTLVECASNPDLNGIDYVLRLISYFNWNGFVKDLDNIYSQKDFDKIFIAFMGNQSYDYHWELSAFIHSTFFSGNQSAVENIMESLNNSKESNFIGFLESKSEESLDLSFCKMCKDFLHLLFMDDNEYSKSEEEFISFFDSLGLIDLLAKMANDSEFYLRREAVIVISATCYNYNIDIMKKLIVDYGFIENFTPFVALDLNIFDASIFITYKILTIIQKLNEVDAHALFERLVNAKIFDELRNAIDQFNLPNPLTSNEQNEDERKMRMSKDLLLVFNLEKEICSLLSQNNCSV